MKKIIHLLLPVCFILTSHTGGRAQTTNNTLTGMNTLKLERPSVRASREFWKLNGEGRNEQWFRLQQGYLATFTEESGIRQRQFFDKNGIWVYSIREYTEKDLPREIRTLVRTAYYDHPIGFVKEVRQGQDLVYVIHVENEAEWKDLAVQEGDIRILKEFSKKIPGSPCQ